MHSHMTTKISQRDRSPNFLSYGALLVHALCAWSSATKISIYLWSFRIQYYVHVAANISISVLHQTDWLNIAGTNPNSVESSIWGKTNKNCMTCGKGNHCYDLMYRSNWSFNMPHPPGHTPSIWQLCRPGEEGIWLWQSSRGWGIWSPCFRCGEFELHPRFHVKSLAWQAIMGNGVLEYFLRKRLCLFLPIGYEERA